MHNNNTPQAHCHDEWRPGDSDEDTTDDESTDDDFTDDEADDHHTHRDGGGASKPPRQEQPQAMYDENCVEVPLPLQRQDATSAAAASAGASAEATASMVSAAAKPAATATPEEAKMTDKAHRAERRRLRTARELAELMKMIPEKDRVTGRKRERAPPTRFLDDKFPEGKDSEGRIRYWRPGAFLAKEYVKDVSDDFVKRFCGRLAHDIRSEAIPASVLVDTTNPAESALADGSKESHDNILEHLEIPVSFDGPETDDENECISADEEEEEEVDVNAL
jgi:hypothetical protein